MQTTRADPITALERLTSMARRTEPHRDYLSQPIWMTTPAAGVRVTEETALTYSAVWCCVRIIAETVAMLPWHAYRRIDDREREMQSGQPADTLLRIQANPEMSGVTFRETMQARALLWGNGVAEIERGRLGAPQALWPIEPHRVNITRDDSDRLIYEISNVGAPNTILGVQDVFHLKGLGTGLVGYSVVGMAREAIALGLATERFGATFFGNGTRPSGVFTLPEALSDTARERVTTELKETGNRNNAHRVLVLEEGMKWESMSVPPEDAQFLESRKFQVTDICRWFRVPPHMVADLERATFSNIEHQGIEFSTHTMGAWFTKWETEANWKLFPPSNTDLYCKFTHNALLRGDALARFRTYGVGIQWGIYSPNEARSFEDMNPREGGDVYLTPTNMRTEGREESAPGEEPEQKQEPETDSEEEEEEARAVVNLEHCKQVYIPLFTKTAERLLRKEVNAICRAQKRLRCDSVGFNEWWLEFYATHTVSIAETMQTLLKTMVATLCSSRMPALVIDSVSAAAAQAYAKRHAEASFEDVGAVKEWLSRRPGLIAEELIDEGAALATDLTPALPERCKDENLDRRNLGN